jgi:hypothetical protein
VGGAVVFSFNPSISQSLTFIVMLHNLTSKKLMLAAIGLFAGGAAFAQIGTNPEGDVGIGTWPLPYSSSNAQLYVHNDFNSGKPFFVPDNYHTAVFEDYSGTLGYRIGVMNNQYAPKGGTSYGLLNQMYISGNGPYSDFTIGSYNYAYGGSSYTYGQYNIWYQYNPGSCSGGTGYGIYNDGYTDTQDEAFGIYNHLGTFNPNCCSKRYGIYSVVEKDGTCGGAGIYSSFPQGAGPAGLFDGDVQVNGNLSVMSDERKKENIGDLKGALAIVQRLKGHTYTFKADENINLAEGEQIGFLAQELETVLPNLVSEVNIPTHNVPNQTKPADPLKKGEQPQAEKLANLPSEEVKTVNYIGVIPVLVEAIKEQQVLIERQQAQIQALEAKIGK